MNTIVIFNDEIMLHKPSSCKNLRFSNKISESFRNAISMNENDTSNNLGDSFYSNNKATRTRSYNFIEEDEEFNRNLSGKREYGKKEHVTETQQEIFKDENNGAMINKTIEKEEENLFHTDVKEEEGSFIEEILDEIENNKVLLFLIQFNMFKIIYFLL